MSEGDKEFSLKEIIERNHEEVLAIAREIKSESKEIKAEVKSTNGRVKSLEMFRGQAKVVGGFMAAILTYIAAPIAVSWISAFFGK